MALSLSDFHTAIDSIKASSSGTEWRSSDALQVYLDDTLVGWLTSQSGDDFHKRTYLELLADGCLMTMSIGVREISVANFEMKNDPENRWARLIAPYAVQNTDLMNDRSIFRWSVIAFRSKDSSDMKMFDILFDMPDFEPADTDRDRSIIADEDRIRWGFGSSLVSLNAPVT